MAAPQYLYHSPNPVEAPVLTNQAVNVGDLCALSSGNVTPAASYTWTTNFITTQANFVAAFLGASAQYKSATAARPYGNGVDNLIRVDTSGEWEFDCTSANFAVGDLVGCDNSGSNTLMSSTVVAVATENLAIGRVTKAGTSVTRVRVRLLSRKAPLAAQS